MDKQEMDRALAEVMGWELRLVSNCFNTYFSNRECWCSGTEVLYACEDWHPTSDWNQMMQVVKKIMENGWYLLLTIGQNITIANFQRVHVDKGLIGDERAETKDPLLAIGEAVLRAAGKWGE